MYGRIQIIFLHGYYYYNLQTPWISEWSEWRNYRRFNVRNNAMHTLWMWVLDKLPITYGIPVSNVSGNFDNTKRETPLSTIANLNSWKFCQNVANALGKNSLFKSQTGSFPACSFLVCWCSCSFCCCFSADLRVQFFVDSNQQNSFLSDRNAILYSYLHSDLCIATPWKRLDNVQWRGDARHKAPVDEADGRAGRDQFGNRTVDVWWPDDWCV